MAILERAIQGLSLTARDDRLINSLVAEGVFDLGGGAFEVTASSPASMILVVGSGSVGDKAAIEGDEDNLQGIYLAMNSEATSTVEIPAADSTDPRLDLVVLRVQDDDEDSGGTDSITLEVVEGTASSSPSAPPVPNSTLLLATVTVSAGATSIAKADIQDDRVPSYFKENFMSGAAVKYEPSDTTVSNTIFTAVIWTSTTFIHDPGGIFSVSNETVTVNATGLYDLRSSIFWNPSSTGRRIIEIKTGSGLLLARNDPSTPDGSRDCSVSTIARLTKGTEIYVRIWQNSGSPLAFANSGELSYIVLRFLGGID